ncbi:MAG TPA: ERAP1-like C-terminal domain-containing protein, partial [Candidatus Nanopelagicales bacterium]|nr:ERAP1-like C-terminal domain-containing protein [Candidatus Nanopelagicales bacterium]
SEYLIRFAERLHDLARFAEAGSDRQLAFTRSFAGAATTNEQLAIVEELLDGTQDWPGLQIDTDLRWFLLQQLIASGARGNDAVEAELQRDDTATGRRQAAMARAAAPTAEAKEQAWQSILHDESLPNAMLEATIAGFSQRDQLTLTDPYIEPYFAALDAVWAERTMEIAQSITMGMFPMFSVDQATIDRAEAFLATEPVPALARLIAEGRDGLVRAQRARAADAARS